MITNDGDLPFLYTAEMKAAELNSNSTMKLVVDKERIQKMLFTESEWDYLLTLIPHELQEFIELHNVKRDSIFVDQDDCEYVMTRYDIKYQSLLLNDVVMASIGISSGTSHTTDELSDYKIYDFDSYDFK